MNGAAKKSPEPFWERPLETLDRGEWEALCDGCGRCFDYKHRMKLVADCVKLDRKNLAGLDWLPSTCAYRLRAAGEPLREWHYLLSGSRETVHEAGQSTRG